MAFHKPLGHCCAVLSCSVVSNPLRPHESQHAISHMYIHIPSLLDFLCCGLCLVAQSCPTLCDPMDYSLPGSSVHGEFSRQEYWSGLPHPPPGDLPNPGIQSRSPSLQEDSLPSEPPRKHTMQKATLSKYRYKFIPDLGSVSSSYKHLPWEIGLENREIWRHLNTPLGQP